MCDACRTGWSKWADVKNSCSSRGYYFFFFTNNLRSQPQSTVHIEKSQSWQFLSSSLKNKRLPYNYLQVRPWCPPESIVSVRNALAHTHLAAPSLLHDIHLRSVAWPSMFSINSAHVHCALYAYYFQIFAILAQSLQSRWTLCINSMVYCVVKMFSVPDCNSQNKFMPLVNAAAFWMAVNEIYAYLIRIMNRTLNQMRYTEI